MQTNDRAGTLEASKKRSYSGIEKLEQAIADRTEPFHYDDLQAFTSVGGFHHAKSRVIRDEEGQIDLLETFKRAGMDRVDNEVDIKGGLF